MLLWRASLRFLTRHPAQCGLAISGIALGVAIVIGMVLTQNSARAAFAASLRSVFGTATHFVVAVDGEDFDEQLLAQVRRAAPTLLPTPVLSGAVGYRLDKGRQSLSVLGVDVFTRHEAGPDNAGIALKFLTTPGAMLLSASTAQRLRLTPGARLAINSAAGAASLLWLGALENNSSAGLARGDDIAIVDIATAQEVLGKSGRLTRIELSTSASTTATAQLAAVSHALPRGLQVIDAAQQARGARNLSDAFYTNLDALSLLALLVGGFMIYNTMAFLVMQRQMLFARLRALGVTRAALARLIVAEALLLGGMGGALGCALGYGLATALLAPIGQTLRDHYAASGGTQVVFTPMLAALGMALAALTTLLAAAVPTWSALQADPAHAARYSVRANSASHGLSRAAWAALACGVLAVVLLGLSSRSLYAGFAALGATILAAMLAVPWLVQHALTRLARRPAAWQGLPVRLAVRGAARSMGRIGMAVAALMAATATSIGVGLMVASFRTAVDDWLNQVLRADVYISSGFDAHAPPRIDPAFVTRVAGLADVAALSQIRRLRLHDGERELRVTAYELPLAAQHGFHFLAGAAPWPAWDTQDLAIISEPLAFHLQRQVGDTIVLPTPAGRRSFHIAGIYTDYGSDSGVLAISLARYRHYWHDQRVHGLGIYPRAAAKRAALSAQLATLMPRDGELALWSNATLKAQSLAVFDRTFAITHALTLFAAAIAALGVFNALLALHLERTREYAMVLALGLAPAALRASLYLQTAVIALLACACALPLGVLIAKLLIAVINIRSFGWSMPLTLAGPALLTPVLGALGAALAATIYPAERALRIDPATALRYE